jgi:anti-anti-sigma factor
MPEKKEKLVIAIPQGAVMVLHVSGSLDHVKYYQLEEAIQTQLDRKQMHLVVNLTELTYISSAGINTLGHAVSQYEKVKGKLCYVRPANTAQWHFFTTIGVDQIFPWATSVEEAVKRVAPPAA